MILNKYKNRRLYVSLQVKDEARKAVLEKIGKEIGKSIMGRRKKPQTKKDFPNMVSEAWNA